MLGEPVKVTGASRTDAGVHALRQVASLTTASAIAPGRSARALNALLPPAIRVLGAREAPAGFDARRCGPRQALRLPDRPGGPGRPVPAAGYAWHVARALDADAMAAALRARARPARLLARSARRPGRGRTPICTVRATRVVSGGSAGS